MYMVNYNILINSFFIVISFTSLVFFSLLNSYFNIGLISSLIPMERRNFFMFYPVFHHDMRHVKFVGTPKEVIDEFYVVAKKYLNITMYECRSVCCSI